MGDDVVEVVIPEIGYLSNKQVKNKIKRQIRKYFEQEENENMRIYGMSPKQINL